MLQKSIFVVIFVCITEGVRTFMNFHEKSVIVKDKQ